MCNITILVTAYLQWEHKARVEAWGFAGIFRLLTPEILLEPSSELVVILFNSEKACSNSWLWGIVDRRGNQTTPNAYRVIN